MIRRPLYYVAAAFAATILLKYYFGWAVVGICCVVLAGAARWKRSGLVLLLLCAGLVSAGTLAWHEHLLKADPALDFLDQGVRLTGIVKEPALHTDSRGQVAVRIETAVREIEGKQAGKTNGKQETVEMGAGGRVLLTVPAEALAGAASGQTAAATETATAAATSNPLQSLPPGTAIRVSGTLKAPEPKRNPNCFDYRLYLKTSGIQAVMRTDYVQVLEERGRDGGFKNQTIRARLFLMREHYLQRIEAHAGKETAGMMRAILFGEKGLLEEDTQTLFQKNGTAHVLAVSGLHVGMLYAALVLVWDLGMGICPSIFGRTKGRRFFAAAALFFGAYTFLAGYAPSVVRAVVMVLLHSFAKMTHRRYDLNCASFAVGIAALAHNPYILFQAGFQMSYLAILTLGLLTPYIQRFYQGALVGSIAIQIGLGPYMIFQFNVLPLLAVFINIPVIFLTGLLVPAGMAGMMLPFGGEVWDTGLACLCKGLVMLNELTCIDGISCLTVASPPHWVLAMWYLGLLLLASEEGRLLFIKGEKHLIKGLIAGILIASIALGQAADDGYRHMDLVFVDVGQGDCMHLRSGGRNFLIDGGGSADYEVGTKTLQPYLLKNGERRIDAAFVTHLHTDHYKGICELAKAGLISRIYIYESNRLKIDQVCEDTGLSKDRISFLRQGQTVRLSREDSLQILWPEGKSDAEYRRMIENEEDENASSLIMRVEISGVSFLATGDLGEDGERELLRTYAGRQAKEGNQGSVNSAGPLHVDFLKVGHHGSKTSTSKEFLDAVGPAFAVIQVGKNNPLLAKEYDIVSK